ncbi:MAG: Gx transporter family protein [Clostridia bacterium]|nr:Gx transporter family protein [Clostridia bacterium]
MAMTALFAALSIVFGYIEHLIPFDFGIPGVKLGLANLVIVTMMYTFSKRQTLFVLFVRIFVCAMLFGNIYSLLYSLAGGVLSFGIMCVLKKIKGFSPIGVSIGGGVAHNIGQLAVAIIVLNSPNIALYLPVLLISGGLTGGVIGTCANTIINRLTKADLTS